MPVELRGTPPPAEGREAGCEDIASTPAAGRARTLPAALVLGGLLLVAVVLSALAWRELGDVAMGPHGWIALLLGALVTLLLGAGLMALVFHSARRGYDDRAGHF